MVKENFVRLIGRLGVDPEVKHLENGSVVCSFSVATNDVYKQPDGEFKTHTDWHRCVCWGKIAERAEKKLKKGDKVMIEGSLKTRSWKDSENKDHSITEVKVKGILPINTDKKKSKEGDDDLPF